MSWDDYASLFLSTVSIAVLAVVGIVIVHLVGRRVLRAVKAITHLPQIRQQQLITLIQIIRWVADIVIVGSALMMTLSTYGIDVTPLLASVGIAGLAVSLGAQRLIQDFVGGILIIAENQYVVGDTIQVGEITGQVERFSLRATFIRDVNGNLHVAPNGEVRFVGNLTRDWSRALIDVGVAYEEDIEHALAVLQDAAEAFAQDSALGNELLESPQAMGPMSLGDWAWTLRVMVKTRPGKQWEVARELQKQILAACEREGIALPYPRQEVWMRDLTAADSDRGKENP